MSDAGAARDEGRPMAEEWFDVVDVDNRVLGRATRAEVHRRGWRHRSAHAVLFNAAGEVFLQKRSPHKDNDPGRWDSSAAGHVEAGETYAACLPRELAEELGWTPDAVPAPRFELPASVATGQEFAQVFVLSAEGPFRLDPVEIDEGRWFAPEAVDAWLRARPDDFTGAFRLIWARLRGWDAAGG